MLEIRKTAISLDEQELLEMERIVTDRDKNEAFRFLKKFVYDRIIHAQQGRLKSHPDTGSAPTGDFRKK